jgi:hypothetical protein
MIHLILWDTATGKEHTNVKVKSGHPVGVSFVQAGKVLAIAEEGGDLTWWNIASRKAGLSIKAHPGMWGMAATTDGKLIATAGSDQTAKLWDAVTGQELATLLGQKTRVGRVAFSSDGKTLATATGDIYGDDQDAKLDEVRVWDVAAKQARAIVQGPRGSLVCLALSSDGKTLITGGRNGVIQLWDIPSARSTMGPNVSPAATERAIAFIERQEGKFLRRGKEIVFVDLSDTKIANADLDLLKELKWLREIRLNDTPISDGALERLKTLDQLEDLWIIHTKVTEEGARAFKKAVPGCSIGWSVDGLVNAMINQNQNLVAAIGEFGGMVRRDANGDITYLELGRKQRRITDAGLPHLRALTKLKYLGVCGDPQNYLDITDAGLKQIRELKTLEQLGIGWTKITDKGLAHLQELPNLQNLDLRGTGITDAGLEHLKKLGSLENLSLGGTGVTSRGIRALQQHLPTCGIQTR